MALRSYGPHSFASLEADDRSYVQVAGGGVTCMIERYTAATGARERAFHDRPNAVFPGGTILAFSGGELRFQSDEWFHADAVVAIFVAFNQRQPVHESVHWRPAPALERSTPARH